MENHWLMKMDGTFVLLVKKDFTGKQVLRMNLAIVEIVLMT